MSGRVIKSQLLCQLSYALTANGKVGTNFDYTIRFAPSCSRPSLRFAISFDTILISDAAPTRPTSTDSQLEFPTRIFETQVRPHVPKRRSPFYVSAVQLSGLRWVWVFRRRDFMSWNKTVLAVPLAGIILSAALAENATAQVPVRTGPSTAPEQL